MCGITGWVDFKADSAELEPVVKRMTATLTHRGPDAESSWSGEHVALGHRRLVVVDPAGGGQPMVRERGDSFVIVYNGELYNTPELRACLEGRGYRFLTRNSDTEALLYAYMEWGEECPRFLNGIFAFAVWDQAEQRLFMARDRLGVKPLFYSSRPQGLLFASEIKALLAHPGVEPVVGREGLAEVLVMGPSRTPGITPYRGIWELRPGCCMLFDRSGIRQRRYWGLESHRHEDDISTTAARVRELLEDTVYRQLVADVPVCTLLSGGIDSSALTALAARAFRESGQPPLNTFSVDYVDNEIYFKPNAYETNYDRPWVKRVSEAVGSDHHYIVINNRYLASALVPAVLANDLPGMTDVDSSLLLFCQEVRKEATVALSGECADEVFGGYPWFHRPELVQMAGFPWIRQVEERSRLLNPDIAEWINPVAYARERYQEALQEVPRLPGEDEAAARIREIAYLSITRFMPTLLDRKDRMSMATSLEVRVPFADHRLVEYVWNIPWELKTWGNQAKGILRQALQGILPADVLARPKSPYPKSHNPQYLDRVRELLLTVLDDPASPLHRLFDTVKVREMATSDVNYLSGPWFGQLMGNTQYLAYLFQIHTWWQHYHITMS